jgi:effector-binding domain-containing protein
MLNGGPDKILGKMYEKSLATIDNSLHKEISTYDIVVDGKVTKMGNNYAYYPINSKISKITKNFRAILPKIEQFLQKNNLESKGKPYILFNKYDVANDFTNFWVCIDLKEEFITGPESEVLTGKSEAFQAVKATLTGDYSHLDETYSKIEEYLLQKGIKQDFAQPFIELYLKSLADEKKSSQWKTVIYIPILIPKKVEYSTYIPKAKTERRLISPVSDIKQENTAPNDIEKSIVIPDLNRPQ